jgi:hypothetical protein
VHDGAELDRIFDEAGQDILSYPDLVEGFLETLGELYAKRGFSIHTSVPMDNHSSSCGDAEGEPWPYEMVPGDLHRAL